MIPILYDEHETQFESNGLGRLTDCVRCIVTEERNGIYECEFDYPVTGEMYAKIKEGCIIACTHDDGHDVQPFDIYGRSIPINGLVTFYAHHISYRLSNIVLKPFTASTCASALSGFKTNVYMRNPFDFWTDKSVTATFKITHPIAAKAALAGQQGSILDVYGTGEYEFDKWLVRLHLHRGSNNGVSIRYGVNLTDIKQTYDESNTYTAVAPYWTNGETGATVMLPEGYVANGVLPLKHVPWTTESGEIVTTGDGDPIYVDIPEIVVLPMDLSEAFDTEPTVDQLRTEALRRLNNSEAWLPSENITVSFIDLAHTTEYAEFSALQRVRLCDRVNVYCGPIGVTAASMQVIKVTYDALTDMYTQIEMGKPKASFVDMVMAKVDQTVAVATQPLASQSQLQRAVDSATSMITGATNSHVKLKYDANGGLQEILVMDTSDERTAVNVWRWNSGGLGFSSNGYGGPYKTAMTADGQIVASMITTGILNADLIQTGTLDGELIKAKLLQIIDDKGKVIGSFGDTITIGKKTYTHAEFDYRTMRLIVNDTSNNEDICVLKMGAMNDEQGYYRTTESFVGDGETREFGLRYNPDETFEDALEVDGVVIPSSQYYIGSVHTLTIYDRYPAPAQGAEVKFSYRKRTPFVYYDLGVRKADTHVGMYSMVFGVDNEASGQYSSAFGQGTKASARWSHAFGCQTEATDDQSFAQGSFTHATGGASHAEGRSSRASGFLSHAEGDASLASGWASHSEGGNTIAKGQYGHAQGDHTISKGRSQTVFGEYNVEDPLNKDSLLRHTYIEIVGNGTQSGRSNARTLKWNGNEWIAGTLTQASDQRLKTESGDIPDVSSIRARRFKWNDKKSQHDDLDHIGYYAQEVEAVAPYLVGEDASGFKSLDYIGFLCAKIESLEKRVTELESMRGDK